MKDTRFIEFYPKYTAQNIRTFKTNLSKPIQWMYKLLITPMSHIVIPTFSIKNRDIAVKNLMHDDTFQRFFLFFFVVV